MRFKFLFLIGLVLLVSSMLFVSGQYDPTIGDIFEENKRVSKMLGVDDGMTVVNNLFFLSKTNTK